MRQVFNPANLETIAFHFKGEKMAKLMGGMCVPEPCAGDVIEGVLVKKNFNCHIVAPKELTKFTKLPTSRVSQRIGVNYSAGFPLLHYLLSCECSFLIIFGVIYQFFCPKCKLFVLCFCAEDPSILFHDKLSSSRGHMRH